MCCPVLLIFATGLAGSCSDSAPTPTEGDWRGEQAGFHLEGGVMSAWWVQGMYCEGADLSAVGGQTCVRVPSGTAGASVPVLGASFAANFGDLSVAGTFVSGQRVEGTWSLSAESCCSEQGLWSAELYAALPKPINEPDAGTTDDGTTPPDRPSTLSSAEAVCARWNSDRAELEEPTWSGGGDCDPGDIDAEGRARVLRQVNLYRALAGLAPVELDEQYNVLAQACSALMDANQTIDHVPPDSWTCYSYDGSKGAGESNLATAPALAAIDLYMGDNGNETTMGHRRWILQNGLGPFGVGSTDQFSCLHVLGSHTVGPSPWTAWPPPGFFPIQVASTLTPVGWSFHNHALKTLEGASVQVTHDGETLPVDSWPLEGGYGGSEAIAFRPDGWSVQAGKTYTVTIDGIDAPVTYTVEVIDCGLL
jgi:uncharacterized protein YkwD